MSLFWCANAPISRQLIENSPPETDWTGKVSSHIDVAACTERGIAVAGRVDRQWRLPELAWALPWRPCGDYRSISNLKHGAWQQSGLKAAGMPPNFGIGGICAAKHWASGAMAALARLWRAMVKRLE